MWRSKGTESSSVYFTVETGSESLTDIPNAYRDMENKDLDDMPHTQRN